MSLNFPDQPELEPIYVAAGKTWRWHAEKQAWQSEYGSIVQGPQGNDGDKGDPDDSSAALRGDVGDTGL